MMWGYDGLGSLWMGLFWVGAVALAAWAVARSAVPNTRRRSPVAILEERFARGEVDRDEFIARRNELARWQSNNIHKPRRSTKMLKRIAAAVALVGAVGLTAVAVPALAQQPGTNTDTSMPDTSVTCPYYDSAAVPHDEMEQWMDANHDQMHAEMYAEMSEHMGNFDATSGYGPMMGRNSMMGYRTSGD